LEPELAFWSKFAIAKAAHVFFLVPLYHLDLTGFRVCKAHTTYDMRYVLVLPGNAIAEYRHRKVSGQAS